MAELTTLICYGVTIIHLSKNEANKDLKVFVKEFDIMDKWMNDINNEKDSRKRYLKINIGIGIIHRLMKDNEHFKLLFNDLFEFIMDTHKSTIVEKMSEINFGIIYDSIKQKGIYEVIDNIIEFNNRS